jgi:hypothetical protein
VDSLLIDEVGFDRLEQESARNASLFFKVIDAGCDGKATLSYPFYGALFSLNRVHERIGLVGRSGRIRQKVLIVHEIDSAGDIGVLKNTLREIVPRPELAR